MSETEKPFEGESPAPAMDDDLATRETVPTVWRPSQAKDRGSAGIGQIQKTIIRHRFEEYGMLVELAARVMGDVSTIAGGDNGMAAAADARIQDAANLTQTVNKNLQDLFRPKGVEVQVVKQPGGDAP